MKSKFCITCNDVLVDGVCVKYKHPQETADEKRKRHQTAVALSQGDHRHAEPLREIPFAVILAQLRNVGWTVAVHNDYKQDGRLMTFWLLTHASGRYVKGEGESDFDALEQIRRQITETP